MKYSLAILAFATAVLASDPYPYMPDYPYVPDNKNGSGKYTTHYTTYTTTAYTTYCPYPTTITYQEKYYTVTEACTYTITDCPCTVTEPILKPSTVLYTSCPPVYTDKPAPVYTSYPVVYKTSNQAAVTTYAPATTDEYKPAQYTGAANANKVGGVMVGALAGLAALAL